MKSVAMSAGVVVARKDFLSVIIDKEIRKVAYVLVIIMCTSERELQKQRHMARRQVFVRRLLHSLETSFLIFLSQCMELRRNCQLECLGGGRGVKKLTTPPSIHPTNERTNKQA